METNAANLSTLFGIYNCSQSEVLVFLLISQIRIYFFHWVQKVPHPVTLLGKIKVFSLFSSNQSQSCSLHKDCEASRMTETVYLNIKRRPCFFQIAIKFHFHQKVTKSIINHSLTNYQTRRDQLHHKYLPIITNYSRLKDTNCIPKNSLPTQKLCNELDILRNRLQQVHLACMRIQVG